METKKGGRYRTAIDDLSLHGAPNTHPGAPLMLFQETERKGKTVDTTASLASLGKASVIAEMAQEIRRRDRQWMKEYWKQNLDRLNDMDDAEAADFMYKLYTDKLRELDGER